MANVRIKARGFKGNNTWVNGTSIENVTKFDICRAAITVGASGYLELCGYGWRYLLMKLCEAFHKSFLVSSPKRNLVLSSTYTYLDKSEKATASYWLGMAFTKLAAERKLRIPWLCHVDRLIDQGVIQLEAGSNSRGDLVGKDNNKEWHVLEAKGRSYNVSSTLVGEAKYQAKRITSINGRPPCSASACIVRLFSSPISVDLVDPKQKDFSSEVSLTVFDKKLYKAYYDPFIEYLNRHEAENIDIIDLDFKIARFEQLGTNIWIGLPNKIIKNPLNAEMIAKSLSERKIEKDDHNFSIGYDGILLEKL